MMQLYTAQDSKQCDAQLIAGGIPAFELMQRAAKRVFEELQEMQSDRFVQSKVLVLVGSGNNGGDGLLVAKMAMNSGMPVTVISLKPLEMKTPESQEALAQAQAANVPFQLLDDAIIFNDALVVDALLGTGFNGELREDLAALIQRVNQSSCEVVAVDVPSGLDANTGAVQSVAIKARATVSFIIKKRGLYTANGADYSGRRLFDALVTDAELPLYREAVAQLKRPVEVLFLDQLKHNLPQRLQNSHKGHNGHCVLIGGSLGMSGAIILAAEACYRAGAGLVTVITEPQTAVALNARLPEAMTAIHANDIDQALSRATCVGIGPGLAINAWAKDLLGKVASLAVPVVLDAGALTLLGNDKKMAKPEWVITPHPKEAAMLLGSDTLNVQQDRFKSVKSLSEGYHCVAVLKGSGSLISNATADQTWLCNKGNPGMSVGGMGDILTGLIAGLMSQGLAPFFAAKLGVELHAEAGDLQVKRFGQIGLLPQDMCLTIKELMNT
ncbi:MAG: NAD(P)H-hydrate dehydratase [Cellvibrionales bacterium]|nr:NAD(P)H-hydrate dehydratase [Cellvibrionales bacterium]